MLTRLLINPKISTKPFYFGFSGQVEQLLYNHVEKNLSSQRWYRAENHVYFPIYDQLILLVEAPIRRRLGWRP